MEDERVSEPTRRTESLETLKAAIERRGYLVSDRSVKERPEQVIWWIGRDDGEGIPGQTPGICRAFSRQDLAIFRAGLGVWIDLLLVDLAHGSRHMACRCGEPLLRRDRPASVPVVARDDHPMPYLTGEIVQALVPEYRSVKAGPDSPALAVCPRCQRLLNMTTVKEIEDPL